ncbi:MAG TPA: CHAT domain-containing tetratricopeptide repeat protein [Acidimicrobiia bacterium]|nr:CHAT domain-containing tetratricopeptide repeat protein [Acidimicrobiia bacterium]
MVDAVQDDPERVRGSAKRVLEAGSLDPEMEATALWALGLAARQLNDLGDSEEALKKGLRITLNDNLSRLNGQIRTSLSLVLLYQGHTQAALDEAQRATDHLNGGELAQTQMQIALIMQRLGRLDDALARYKIALRGLRRAGDRRTEALLLMNRGVLHGYMGHIELGVADQLAARQIGVDIDKKLLAAMCAGNLGFLEGRRGDVPAALVWFDQAEHDFDSLGRPTGMVEVLDADRAQLLLHTGLISEAEKAVTRALTGMARSDNKTDLSEIRVLAAEVALAADKPDEARSLAQSASDEFTEQERHAWALLADYLALRARFQMGTTERADVMAAGNLAGQLVEAGLIEEARHCRILAGRIALDSSDLAEARRWLTSAAGARRSGTSVGRTQAWYAEALLRIAEGNSYGAWRAIDAGQRVIRDYRATLGARDLRAHAASHGLDLARLALDHAVKKGSPWRVLDTVESWRAISRQVDSVRPPDDPELNHLLAELRRIDSEVRDRALAGERTDRLLREKARTEGRVRAVSRKTRGQGAGIDADKLDRSAIETALDGRRLLSYFAHEGTIGAVSMVGSKVTIHQLADLDQVTERTISLLRAVTRLAVGAGTRRSLDATYSTMLSARHWLREALLPDPGDDTPVVVIPAGDLHRLPWPALTGVPTSVAPSLAAWLAAKEEARPLNRSSRAALVAGPRLPAARREIDRLSHIYGNRTRLTGRNARARKVADALDGCEVAHVAAHGDFRWDNPSFSSLEMADGSLTAYELEQLKSPPSTVVLSSCDMAVSRVIAGDELLGLSSVLIHVGVSNLVAPLVPISDDLAADLVVPLHRFMADGASPATALARANAQFDSGTPQEQALAASFVSIGA